MNINEIKVQKSQIENIVKNILNNNSDDEITSNYTLIFIFATNFMKFFSLSIDHWKTFISFDNSNSISHIRDDFFMSDFAFIFDMWYNISNVSRIKYKFLRQILRFISTSKIQTLSKIIDILKIQCKTQFFFVVIQILRYKRRDSTTNYSVWYQSTTKKNC